MERFCVELSRPQRFCAAFVDLSTGDGAYQPSSPFGGSPGISHSSSKSCVEFALFAGSQTKILRMKLSSLVFSSPDGNTVTKSSSTFSGIATSQIHSPICIGQPDGHKRASGALQSTFVVKVVFEAGIVAPLQQLKWRRAEEADVLR